uniref:Uncharacterized protein n=1 Tax=Anguilla anguilla TaxID=7936 RepID=A0A0E9XUC5_ANGAN
MHRKYLSSLVYNHVRSNTLYIFAIL